MIKMLWRPLTFWDEEQIAIIQKEKNRKTAFEINPKAVK